MPMKFTAFYFNMMDLSSNRCDYYILYEESKQQLKMKNWIL